MIFSILGLVVLILDIVAVVRVLQSRMSVGAKVLWILVIFFLPLLGMILYFLLGDK